MNCKYLAMSMVLASAALSASAQTETDAPKGSDNIFFQAGAGVMSVINDGFNKPTLNLNVAVGKYITPVWGVRAQVSGAWQTLSSQNTIGLMNVKPYNKSNKFFVETNFDGMINLTNLFRDGYQKHAVDLTFFAGPTVNFSSAVSGTYNMNTTVPGANIIVDGATGAVQTNTGTPTTEAEFVYTEGGAKTRVGATAGLDLAYNVNDKLAINLEGRFGVTPSIFGMGSDCRKAEATARFTAGIIYTFGGKNFKKASTKIVEKEVIREVPKEVIKEVVKEVKVEAPSNAVAAAAVFFKIGKTDLSDEGRVNIKLIAEAIKKSPAGVKYQVAGSADKATGSAALNQKLSEKRSQVVYDALIAEGVSPSQLEIVAKGGVDPLFFSKDKLSRVTVIEVK